MTRVSMTVNGNAVTQEVSPRTNLADFLREELLLTGTHIGCEHGICGACTVEIDGEIARSCITWAVTCDGAEVRTIEGFDDDPLMTKLRSEFSAEHALQCGYCTPGMLIAARDLICRGEAADEASIRVGMSGNLCRCTGYMGIVKAIGNAAASHKETQQARPEPRTLGPAPGPEATDTFEDEEAAPTAPARSKTASQATPDLPQTAAANVQTGQITQDGKYTRLTQTITVQHPREDVWRFMTDIEKVAACMPGVTLDGPPENGHVTGRMLVKLGPITADLKGDADVSRMEDEWRGVIDGRGRDTRSASMASGQVEYRLEEAEASNATQIEVSIAYSLAGPLAQFSRGALVRDLVSRLASAFAHNLEARLSGREAPAQPAALDAGSLVFSVIRARIRGFFAWLFGRGRR